METFSIIVEGVAETRRVGTTAEAPVFFSETAADVDMVLAEPPTACSYLSAKVRRVAVGKEGVEPVEEAAIVPVEARRTEEVATEGLVRELPRVRRP